MVNDVTIGPALDGIVRSPLWSYQLGFLNGCMLTDLRGCVGVCAVLGAAKDPFDGVSSACKRGAQMPRKSSHGRRVKVVTAFRPRIPRQQLAELHRHDVR
ncbi:hypothetical protein B0H14DRAFT_3476443 [Mycena olivaceomarginata]|nr:hypothetical protein B0H14DRAFT_3476443 [Mycena olivaceomarginata]